MRAARSPNCGAGPDMSKTVVTPDSNQRSRLSVVLSPGEPDEPETPLLPMWAWASTYPGNRVLPRPSMGRALNCPPRGSDGDDAVASDDDVLVGPGRASGAVDDVDVDKRDALGRIEACDGLRGARQQWQGEGCGECEHRQRAV